MKMKHLKKGRIILVPYPAQGHVSPMQKLACAFLNLGFEPIIVLPRYLHRQILLQSDYSDHDDIKWVALPDGQAQQGNTSPGPDFFAIESAMENIMPPHLQDLLHKLAEDGDVACLVVDLLASWAIEVAQRCGIPIAGFWPAMFATYLLIAAIPHMLRRGLISDSGVPQDGEKISLGPELPVISAEDLPWLIGTVGARKARFKFWKRALERSTSIRWLLVNSFPEESKVEVQIELGNSQTRVLAIGHICRHQLTKSVSFWEEDLSCLKWLAKQKANSVVYISFGSWVSPIGETKLKNLALALEASKRPFIWVLRPTWRQGLPIGFLERVVKQGRGRVVCWAPQTQILQHHSVACYVTHCGWNSILEALQFQKKLLCYPLAGDQFLNCAYVVQIWRVGFKLNGLGLKDVEEGLLRVMEDEEMNSRLKKLHEIIMGLHGDNKRGSFMLKTFVEDLKKASYTSTITENAS